MRARATSPGCGRRPTSPSHDTATATAAAPAVVALPTGRRGRGRRLAGRAMRAGAQVVSPVDDRGRAIGSSAAARTILSSALVVGRRSVWSVASAWSAGSILSVASGGSAVSLGSAGSILSIGSAGSVLSIGSIGSVLSIGSIGSVGAIGGLGRRLDGSTSRAVGAGATVLAVAALGSAARPI